MDDVKKDAGTCEDSIGKIFENVNSISIQKIHFIDNKKFTHALIEHIALFYNCFTLIKYNYLTKILN